MRKKKLLSRISAGAFAALMVVTMLPAQPATAAASISEIAYEGSTEDIKRVSVHDPSIVKDPESGTYYVFGSHLATAKSEDLVNWTAISKDYENAENNPVYGNIYENFEESFQWAGYDDGDCAGGNLAVWAPDVFWNEDYEWKDGSRGAWLLYYSASSTWRRSCIGYAASKNIEGPYTYVDTILYSGITSSGAVDGNSTKNTKWNNDYLNFNELINKTSANGGIDAINGKWFKADGSYNTDYAPNAIDPTIIRDKNNELYMVYGSWSGGLFVLPMDKKTGNVIYPGKDSTDTVSGNYTDRYYGTHIAGGNHQSGEGAYILYDQESGYYYMYETYGGLTRTGGYNMRLFRSENITGPYVDAAGNQAQDSGVDHYKYGIKLIGNYQFYNQRGYCAAGHNSAFIDSDGSRYLLFHQRFNEGTEYHELRVRQQFLNKAGWPVTAVYENRSEKISTYTKSQVTGTYEWINHGTEAASGAMLPTGQIELLSDGTVTGTIQGTWNKTNSKKGYNYITIKTDSAVYQGVFFQQTNDNGKRTMTFSAIGNDNQCVWGSMLNLTDEEMAKRASTQISIPSATRENITLPDTVQGASVTWKSSNTKVITTTGAVKSQAQDTKVTLTAAIQYNQSKVEASYNVTVYATPKLVCGYDFESEGKAGKVPAMKDASNQENALLMGAASVVSEEGNTKRGKVLSLTNQAGAKGVNFMKLPESTFQGITKAGYTISMWVNVSQDTWEHSALFEADAKAAYPMTRIGVNLIGRINAAAYSDAVSSSTGTRGQWQQVTYTVGTDGICVYLNGELVGRDVKDITDCFNAENTASIQHAADVSVGSGYIWGDEDVRSASFDNVEIYDGVMTAEEVRMNFNSTK